jgi:hypothetical protein
MAKPPPKGPIPIAVRQLITWRIPIDLLAQLDKVRGRKERTQCVVEALQLWLAGNTPRRKVRA